MRTLIVITLSVLTLTGCVLRTTFKPIFMPGADSRECHERAGADVESYRACMYARGYR